MSVQLVFRLARRYAPAQPPAMTAEELRQLAHKYRHWEAASLVPFFLFAGALTYLIFLPLCALHEHVLASRGPAEFVRAIDPRAYLVPALFLGICASAVPMLVFYRLLLGRQRFAEYSIATRYRQGFDANRLFLLLVALIVPLSVVLTFLFVDDYTLFRTSEIVTNPFLGVTEARHPYADVTGIYEVEEVVPPIGSARAEPHWVIAFRDGSRWNSRYGSEAGYEADAEVMRFVAKKAGVTLQRVRRLP